MANESQQTEKQRTEYRVAYVDFRGRIGTDGVEFIRRSGEHRAGFVTRYLNAFGGERWALAAVHPLRRSESSYFILQRPLAAGEFTDASAVADPQEAEG